jgi:hypothetical protein
MAEKELQRISIGFHGGQVLALRVADKALDALRKALEKGDWHDIEAEDGNVRVNLSQVVYLRTERDEHRVGFGLS